MNLGCSLGVNGIIGLPPEAELGEIKCQFRGTDVIVLLRQDLDLSLRLLKHYMLMRCLVKTVLGQDASVESAIGNSKGTDSEAAGYEVTESWNIEPENTEAELKRAGSFTV